MGALFHSGKNKANIIVPFRAWDTLLNTAVNLVASRGIYCRHI